MTLKVEDHYWKTDGLTEELLEYFNSSDSSIDDNCADEGVNTDFSSCYTFLSDKFLFT